MYSSKTYKAIPTGEAIQEKLNEKGISFEEFARLVSMSYYEARCLLNGERIVTPKIAKRLEEILKIDREYFLKLEAKYRQDIVRVMLENELGIKED